jgi:hypothetical protein
MEQEEAQADGLNLVPILICVNAAITWPQIEPRNGEILRWRLRCMAMLDACYQLQLVEAVVTHRIDQQVREGFLDRLE